MLFFMVFSIRSTVCFISSDIDSMGDPLLNSFKSNPFPVKPLKFDSKLSNNPTILLAILQSDDDKHPSRLFTFSTNSPIPNVLYRSLIFIKEDNKLVISKLKDGNKSLTFVVGISSNIPSRQEPAYAFICCSILEVFIWLFNWFTTLLSMLPELIKLFNWFNGSDKLDVDIEVKSVNFPNNLSLISLQYDICYINPQPNIHQLLYIRTHLLRLLAI